MWTPRSNDSQDELWQGMCYFFSWLFLHLSHIRFLPWQLKEWDWSRKGGKKLERSKWRSREWWNEWWNNEVLIRISLCWHSVGILHFISPLYPPPTGRRATSQSALLRGLFNNGEGRQNERGNDFPGAVGAPSVTFTSSKALNVRVLVWWPCARLMIPPSGTLTRGTKLSW